MSGSGGLGHRGELSGCGVARLRLSRNSGFCSGRLSFQLFDPQLASLGPALATAADFFIAFSMHIPSSGRSSPNRSYSARVSGRKRVGLLPPDPQRCPIQPKTTRYCRGAFFLLLRVVPLEFHTCRQGGSEKRPVGGGRCVWGRGATVQHQRAEERTDFSIQ